VVCVSPLPSFHHPSTALRRPNTTARHRSLLPLQPTLHSDRQLLHPRFQNDRVHFDTLGPADEKMSKVHPLYLPKILPGSVDPARSHRPHLISHRPHHIFHHPHHASRSPHHIPRPPHHIPRPPQPICRTPPPPPFQSFGRHYTQPSPTLSNAPPPSDD